MKVKTSGNLRMTADNKITFHYSHWLIDSFFFPKPFLLFLMYMFSNQKKKKSYSRGQNRVPNIKIKFFTFPHNIFIKTTINTK